ncbi:MAG: hypothetical protein HS122_12935 [Opitutaceae bacterium]|nr:hypothetical protein [Opitutaceae bacterium]
MKIDRNTYNGTTDITCYSSVNPYYVPNGTPQITGPIVATYRMKRSHRDLAERSPNDHDHRG